MSALGDGWSKIGSKTGRFSSYSVCRALRQTGARVKIELVTAVTGALQLTKHVKWCVLVGNTSVLVSLVGGGAKVRKVHI